MCDREVVIVLHFVNIRKNTDVLYRIIILKYFNSIMNTNLFKTGVLAGLLSLFPLKSAYSVKGLSTKPKINLYQNKHFRINIDKTAEFSKKMIVPNDGTVVANVFKPKVPQMSNVIKKDTINPPFINRNINVFNIFNH